jgi:hypothetical protein
MEIRVRKAEYYYAIVENRPGEARKLMEFCSGYGINLINFTAFPMGENLAQLDFFTDDAEKLKQASADAGIDLIGPKRAFLIQGDERISVLAEYYLRLADSGINVIAANGTSDGSGGFGYVVWVKPEDYDEAAKILGI